MLDSPNYRILFADHVKKDMRYLTEITKNSHDLSIDIASTAKDAILYIDYHAYDLILSHMNLPELEAELLINYAGKSFQNSKTPIVLFNSNNFIQHQNIQKLRNLVFDIVDHPLSEINLIETLHFYIRQIEKEKILKDLLQIELNKRELLGLELEKSLENFQNIVEKSNVGILIVDEKGYIQFVNNIGQQIFLRKKEELTGSLFGIIFEDDKKTEIAIVRKNGELGVGEISVSATQWKGKTAQLVMINDITNHKKLQENLEIAKEKAQESDKLKTAFLANMSHEIRTPLNGILGFSQLMEQKELTPEKRNLYLSSISACGNHLLDIINDIIDIAQIEAGQLKLNLADFDITMVMSEIHDIFRNNHKIISNNIALNFHTSAIQHLTIHSDSTRFRQILVNLVNNAIKFTEKGSIDVGVTFCSSQMLQFYIKDTGIGILNEDKENIFKRFQQVKENNKQLNEGNGLGLSISKALVELLGGKISMESKIGEGSTFYFTLPAKKNEIKNHIPLPNNQKQNQSNKIKKILVVEDDEINFMFIQSVIKDLATTILWAKNGIEAITMAKNENVDLILMDMKLPIMNGYDATKEIRLMFPDLPIIAQTAYAMGGDKQKVFEAGCNDYITKPIKINDLLFKMNAFFN